MNVRVKTLIAGLVILAFSIAILNANRPERTNEVADELVEATSVLPENEGKLVIVSGTPELTNGGVIIDEEASLLVQNAVYYSRVPYQKVYALRTREVVVDKGEDKNSDYDDVTKTEYYVVQDWINANQKRDAVVYNGLSSYENPPAVNLPAYHASGDLRVAGFKVSSADVSEYIETENCSFSQEELEEACGEYMIRSEIGLKATTSESGHGMLSNGDDIGSVHVLFSYTTLKGAQPVTIIGRQQGDELVLGEDDVVSEGEHIKPGAVSKDEFLEAIASEDSSSRMIGIGGIVLSAILILVSLGFGKR